jgi:hypothetical protein
MNRFKAQLVGGLFICLLLSLKLCAQVVMSVQVPPAGIIQQSQLWNMVLTNSYASPVMVTVMMRLSDAGTGQPVLTGLSRTIELAGGARQLHLNDVSPVAWEYLSTVADRRENALLPPGRYVACYSAVVSGSKADNPVTEDCVNFIVEPVSPPLLNTPVNNDLVEAPQPQFTWIPPTPLNLFTDLNYDLVLVEVDTNQSAEEAIQLNMPVYRISNLHQPFINYPAGAPVLDTGITYAWMITANNGRQFAAQTNAWVFRMKRPGNAVHEDLAAFVELKRTGNKVINCGNMVKCSYVNEPADKKVRYEIRSLEENNRVVRHGNINLQPGTNMIALPLDKGSRLLSGKLYVFSLYNSRAEDWGMKFIYNPQL